MDILEADSIVLCFGDRTLLQNIYLKLTQGQIVGLFGRNGTGKSCLLRTIFGTQTTDNKSIRLNGTYIARPYLSPKLIRYLPQYSFVPASMKVSTAFEYYEINPKYLQKYNLQIFDNQLISQLSGGERRFLETLLILLSPVKFVLLDEPFSHLSPIKVELLSEIIKDQKTNKGILLTDHLYKQVLPLTNTNYLLADTSLRLLKNPIEELHDRGYV